jgi:cellulose synthase/poly-beta-1,6-N-acetylglucosamine synthase-like glycosyltransferase
MFFSVVIPTFNRPVRLVACLESLTRLDYEAWELIVVNDGGEHSFTAVSNQLCRRLPLRLATIGQRGPAAARNYGASLARGTHLAFTDDDCRLPPDWLRRLAVQFQADPELAAVGGRPLTPQSILQHPDALGSRVWQFLNDFLNQYLVDAQGNALLLLSNNVAYQREAFTALGGFDETFPLAAAEDMELGYRLLAQGYRQRYVPDITVWHDHQMNGWGHLRQQFRYGRGAHFFYMALRRGGITGIQPAGEHTFYLALWSAMRRVRLPLRTGLLLAAGQMAYQMGTAYQTAWAFRPHRLLKRSRMLQQRWVGRDG